jgi:uncharacterized membrane protein YqjE
MSGDHLALLAAALALVALHAVAVVAFDPTLYMLLIQDPTLSP